MNLLPRFLVSAAVLLSASTPVRTSAVAQEPQSASAPSCKTSAGVGENNGVEQRLSFEGQGRQFDQQERGEEAQAWRMADAREGGVVGAYLPTSGVVGEPLTLTLSIKNFAETEAPFDTGDTWAAFRVWMRDDGGKPVERIKPGWKLGLADTASTGSNLRIFGSLKLLIEPGCGWGIKVPLQQCFDLSRPGRYEVVARYAYDLYSRRIAVEIQPRSRTVQAGVPKATNERWVTGESFAPAVRFDEQWQAASSVAGRTRGGLTLEVNLSPIAPRVFNTYLSPLVPQAFNLAVSLTNVGTNADPAPYWQWSREVGYAPEDGVKTEVGIKATDYHLLLRDDAGNPVPMTPEGQDWLQIQDPARQLLNPYTYGMAGAGETDQGPRQTGSILLRPGDAVGFGMPLHRLFPLRVGQRYTALVVLPGKLATDAVWVSPMVTINIPEPEMFGPDRPLYGSGRMWDRLLRTAGLARSGLKLKAEIISARAGSAVMHLEAKAPEQDRTPSSLNIIPESTVILVRDSLGAPVLTNQRGGCLGGICWSPVAGTSKAVEKYASRCQDLSLSYHLLPGERYTLLAAVGVEHSHAGESVPAESLLVATPVTFVVPAENAASHLDGGTDGGRCPSSIGGRPGEQWTPGVPPTLSPQQRWDFCSQFAGKPYNGMVLEASAHRPDQLLLALRNCRKEGTWIKKWSDESDYDILVRDPQGKLLQLTDKGKRFFQGGKTLDAHHLKEGETIKATLPIGELFDTRAPGEYTVLASLPVIGDTIDAVLTAAPVRIRIDAVDVQPKARK